MNHPRVTTFALLAQADLFLLLADLFRPPAHARPRLINLTADDLDDLVRVAELADAPDLLAGLRRVHQAWQEVSGADWSDEFHRLFEGAMLCPLNETAVIRRDKGAIIGDLAGYYRAFGWAPTAHSGEKPDHLVAELEFMAILLAMQARAVDLSQVEPEQVVRMALASFASDHAGEWLPSLCQRIEESSRVPLYAHGARALAAAWRAMASAHAWDLAPTPAEGAAPSAETESPYECAFAPSDPIVPLTIDARETAGSESLSPMSTND